MRVLTYLQLEAGRQQRNNKEVAWSLEHPPNMNCTATSFYVGSLGIVCSMLKGASSEGVRRAMLKRC
jgi:hypothetical protein